MSDNVIQKHGKKPSLSISERSTILRRLGAGELAINLAKEYNVTQSAISHIKQRRENIVKAQNVLESCEGNLHKKRYRGKEDAEIEKQLYEWFKQQRAMGVPVSGPILQNKALFFYNRLGSENEFKASSGWLRGFKKRHGIRYLSIQSEKLSADPRASEAFKETMTNIINETGISLDHIYNCDETELYWKLLPNKTLVCRHERRVEGRKKPKNRVTVMMCSNASGSHKIPLFVIGKAAHPRCFKDINNLPVVYDHQTNASMDRNLMMKWYSSIFVPQTTREHDLKHNPDIKIILIMDNAACHLSAQELNVYAFHIVMYLPPNVTSLMQPMDQGIIETFKKCYKHILLTNILDNNGDCKNFLNLFNLLDCCNFCALAWNEVTPATIRNCWKNIIPLENNPVVAMNKLSDITVLHSLVIQIPELNGLSLQDITDWVDVDAGEVGWQPCSDEDILYGQSPNNENVVKEWNDEITHEDQESTDENHVFQNDISLAEVQNASKLLLKWYQRCQNNEITIVHKLQQLNQMLTKQKVAKH